MTHLKEKEIRHVLGLPNSESIMISVEVDYNDFLILTEQDILICENQH